MLTGTRRTQNTSVAVSAISEHLDARTAIGEVADTLHEGLRGAAPDLVLLLSTFHHARVLPEAALQLRRTLGAGHLLGGTVDTVMGDGRAPEGRPAAVGLALHLPGARLRAWRSTPRTPMPLSRPDDLATMVGLQDDSTGVLILGDPYTTPGTKMVPTLAACAGRHVPVFGGLLSGSSQAGGNCIMLDDIALNEGCVGLTFAGVDVDVFASEGCLPIGDPFVVTQCEQNVITQLGGLPAAETLQALVESLPEEHRALTRNGLLLGQAIDSNKKRFGRGDFSFRAVMGVHPDKGIAVAAVPKVGRTVQFHIRHPQAADEDLRLLLDGQSLDKPPLAIFATSSNARGKAFFGHEAHDPRVLRERLNKPPLAGFHAMGAFGPVGTTCAVHGQSIVAAMFRSRG
jgi:small ligand-binding sensory domain FIST